MAIPQKWWPFPKPDFFLWNFFNFFCKKKASLSRHNVLVLLSFQGHVQSLRTWDVMAIFSMSSFTIRTQSFLFSDHKFCRLRFAINKMRLRFLFGWLSSMISSLGWSDFQFLSEYLCQLAVTRRCSLSCISCVDVKRDLGVIVSELDHRHGG